MDQETGISNALRPGGVVSLGSAEVVFRVLGADTGGAYSVLEYVGAPGAGSGRHRHTKEDESFYVVEGEMTFQLEDETSRVPAGGFVRIPVGTNHLFVNSGDQTARALIIITPSGLEGFFAGLGAILTAAGEDPPDVAALDALNKQYGLEF